MRLRIIQDKVNRNEPHRPSPRRRPRRASGPPAGRSLFLSLLICCFLPLAACGDNAFSPGGDDDDGGGPPLDREPVTLPDTVDLVELVQSLEAEISGDGSGGYLPPSASGAAEFVSALQQVDGGALSRADSVLGTFGYDALSVVEASTGDSLVVVTERTPTQRGWGSFILSPASEREADLHVLHPLSEAETPRLGAATYLGCGCRWLFVAGAHRDARADGSADMARSAGSVLQVWFESMAHTAPVTVSVRGFDPRGRSSPTADSDVILSLGSDSDGDLAVTDRARALRDLLRDRDLVAGLVGADPGYTELTGSLNLQGRFANDRFGHGRWIQVHAALPLRLSTLARGELAGALAEWVRSF